MAKNNKNVDEIKESLSNIGKNSFNIVKSVVKITDEFLDEKSKRLKQKASDLKSPFDTQSDFCFFEKPTPKWDNKANSIFDYRSFPLGLDSKNKIRVWLPDTSHLLLTGEPGTGKTNLIRSLVSHSSNNTEKWDTILYEPVTPPEISKNYLGDKLTIVEKTSEIEKIIEELVSQEKDENSKRTLLIIDGIEDLNNFENQEKFFDNLRTVLKENRNVFVVLTSISEDVDLVGNLTLKRIVKESVFSQVKFRQHDSSHNPIIMNLPKGVAMFFDIRLDPSGELIQTFKNSD